MIQTTRPGHDDAWLDEALRSVEPPPVSDTLRARVLRHFDNGARPAPAAATGSALNRNRAVGVAAALILAVVLGVANPAPRPAAPDGATAASLALAPEDEDGAVRAGLALIDDGPGVSDLRLALVSPYAAEPDNETGDLLDGLAIE